MAIIETSEVRSSNCPNCLNIQTSTDLVTDDLQKLIDEYNKLAKEKDWEFFLKEVEWSWLTWRGTGWHQNEIK